MTENNEINEKEQYALSYIQKQENFILEVVRKTMNLEINISTLNNKIKQLQELTNHYEEQIKNQNDIKMGELMVGFNLLSENGKITMKVLLDALLLTEESKIN